jgi:hypothetical protein
MSWRLGARPRVLLSETDVKLVFKVFLKGVRIVLLPREKMKQGRKGNFLILNQFLKRFFQVRGLWFALIPHKIRFFC